MKTNVHAGSDCFGRHLGGADCRQAASDEFSPARPAAPHSPASHALHHTLRDLDHAHHGKGSRQKPALRHRHVGPLDILSLSPL